MTQNISYAGNATSARKSRQRASLCGRATDVAADRVLALVAAHDRVPKKLLLHPSRCRAPVAHARQLAMYLMHTLLGRTMAEVGDYFGRDRTTVSHACGRIEDRRDDDAFEADIAALELSLAAQAHPVASDSEGQRHVLH